MTSGYEFTPSPEKAPDTQAAFSGGPPHPPPRPPKRTAQDLLDPGEAGKRIFLPDYIEVNDLAGLLGLKPFKVVADLLELRVFKHANEFVDFKTASMVAQKNDFIVERVH